MLSPDKESKSPSKELRQTQALEWIEPDRQICKLDTASPKIDDNELEELFYNSPPTFGPFYITDILNEVSLVSKHKKMVAWRHVLEKDSLMSKRKAEAWQHILVKESFMSKLKEKVRKHIFDRESLMSKRKEEASEHGLDESSLMSLMSELKEEASEHGLDESSLMSLMSELMEEVRKHILDEESLMSKRKEEAWQHILKRADDSNTEATATTYRNSLRNIETHARRAYVDGVVDDESKVTSEQFIEMMIKDGCFILQMALLALGGSEQLCFPSDHLAFGEKQNPDMLIRIWIKSLFFVGNQIPLVVLRELMNQRFFQEVVMKGKWEQPLDLFKRVLYDLLVLPVLEERSQQRHHTPTTLLQALKQKLRLEKKYFLLQQQPTDLLHGLQMLLIGPEGDSPSSTKYKNLIGPEGDSPSSTKYKNHETVPLDTKSSSSSYKIRSATELRQKGIHFKRTKGIGSGGIKFTANMFRAVLTLPPFLVADSTEVLFRYLKNYEISQPLGSNKRDVCSYLQFMSELIRASEDVELLVESGIISRTTPEQRERLPGILERLATGDTNPNLRLVSLKIAEYSRPPWNSIGKLVLLLTVVQTIYTVLSYYKNP